MNSQEAFSCSGADHVSGWRALVSLLAEWTSGLGPDHPETARSLNNLASISTGQVLFPHDSTTVAAGAGGTPMGSVTFKLFGPDNSTCDPNGASPVYTQAVSLANGSASTSNTTFSVSAASASTYKWLVVYDEDATHDGATSALRHGELHADDRERLALARG